MELLAFFAHEFGIRPWEWWEMDQQDARHLIKVARATIAARKKR